MEKFLRGSYGFIELEHRKFLTPLSRGPLKKFENSSEREKGRKKERDVGYEKIFAPTYLELENFEEKTKERWVWNNFWNRSSSGDLEKYLKTRVGKRRDGKNVIIY